MDDDRMAHDHGSPEHVWPDPGYISPLKGRVWPERKSGQSVEARLDVVAQAATCLRVEVEKW